MIVSKNDITSSVKVANHMKKNKNKMKPLQMLKDNMNKIHEKVMEESINKNNSRGFNSNKFQYVLEMGYVCVYTTDKEGKKKLVDRISLKKASPEVLSKVENISMMDILILNDMKKEDMVKENKKKKIKNDNMNDIESNNNVNVGGDIGTSECGEV
ncbi:hypothetical protein [Clostridium senegalense]|uniref:hypothetical protein n=1 Tax=Clostridium senegalense TaxID=1465809 RepID=UPI00028A0FD4|nr:hypothetical protein [Clostridium senegalense]